MKYFFTLFLSLYILSNSTFGQLQLSNPGFEDGIDSLATGWAFDIFAAGRDTNYYSSGNYSMSVWTWYYYAQGVAFNSDNNTTSAWNISKYGGEPISHKPAILSGFYHFDTLNTQSNNDSAIIEVLLKKYNNTLAQVDTVGYGSIKLPGTDLSQNMVDFEIPIIDLMTGVNPDSIIVVLKSAENGFCDMSTTGNCLYFYVDDLLLAYPLGDVIAFDPSPKRMIWPNPTSKLIHLESINKNCTISVYNMYGKLIKQYFDESTINVEFLKPGTYFLSIENDDIKEHHKFIKY